MMTRGVLTCEILLKCCRSVTVFKSDLVVVLITDAWRLLVFSVLIHQP